MKKLLLLLFIFCSNSFFPQAPNGFDLIACSSSDGITWTNNNLFQDSAGVPSITQHSTGTIYCAFQWFPAPASPTNTAFDKVAVKKSTDGGLTWGTPTLAVFNGLPPTFKKPFDPTLVIADNGQIRMYFSSSKTNTLTMLDSTYHCYSAISSDGVNYTWEPGVRVAVADSITIDPAAVKIGSSWHYTAPRAFPAAGAFHFISNDGLAFTRTTTIASDANHNFTGNLMSDIPGGGSTFRFYGTPSPQTGAIWFKSTIDGIGWNPTFTNCVGSITSNGVQADPAVIKLGAGNYIMVYVSKYSNVMGLNKNKNEHSTFTIYPNPLKDQIHIALNDNSTVEEIKIYDIENKLVFHSTENIPSIKHNLNKGIYFIEVKTKNTSETKKIIID